MPIWFYICLILYVISQAFTFKYQRITLEFSRELAGSIGDWIIYPFLAPKWLNYVIRINKILFIILIVSSLFLFSWIWILILLLLHSIGPLVTSLLIPFPTRKQSQKIILAILDKELKATQNIQEQHSIVDLRSEVINYFK